MHFLELLWLCRATGIIRSHNPDFFLLMETRLDVNRMDDIRRRLGFVGCFIVPATGRVGGMCLTWHIGVDLDIVYSDE